MLQRSLQEAEPPEPLSNEALRCYKEGLVDLLRPGESVFDALRRLGNLQVCHSVVSHSPLECLGTSHHGGAGCAHGKSLMEASYATRYGKDAETGSACRGPGDMS